MKKKELSEQDIRTKYITPAVTNSGWDIHLQVREEVSFTKGRIFVQGNSTKRAEPKRADYILYLKPNIPIAVIEAKDNKHSLGDGMQQALDYANTLDIPFAFSSNGDGFLMHDKTVCVGEVETKLSLDSFPGPEELFNRYKLWKNIAPEEEKIITQDYYTGLGVKIPYYFQQTAINRSIEAISKGQDRILLVMATGTGKTYTAFQIIWRLWKAGEKKRILFLADRNILIDQAMVNDFKHFGDKMTKVKHHNIDKSYEVYLALYQGITGTEEISNVYKQFSAEFFDLVVIDECHRGSAAADAAWREILEYFTSATQIGLTATPKETKEVSNIDYFGNPIFTYSLKQGIEDGFLAPYKVVRITLDKDVEGYRPEIGKTDIHGEPIPDETYEQKDFDRILVIDERTQLVAKRITEFLQQTDHFSKTIVFCVDIDHAERLRQALVNENAKLVQDNPRYIMRITGDNDIGKAELDNFIDPESRFPVIVTTSKLLTTGVDAQTCKLIVLDANIQSMTEFKQIIGRGTRVREDFNKLFFTIMDFRKVTELFSDPDFDGDPVQIYEPKPGESPVPPESPQEPGATEPLPGEPPTIPPVGPGGESPGEPVRKYYVRGVDVKVINERVQYLDSHGKLITESLRDYSKKNILKEYGSLDDFLQVWGKTKRKKAIIQELEDQGVFWDELAKDVGKDLDPFDLVCHVAFGQKPLTRKERARNVKKQNYFTKYGEQARMVIGLLIDKYADEGIEHIEDIKVLGVQPFNKIGTPYEIVNSYFGGREAYIQAVNELEQYLYAFPQ